MKGDRPVPQQDKKMAIEFEATEQQIKEIAMHAIKYSKNVGLGFLRGLENLDIHPGDIKLDDSGLSLDYVNGRCVKLFIDRLPDNRWRIRDSADPEYQTWARRWVSNETLVEYVLGAGKTTEVPADV
ncbi:hypothetical protein QUA10_28415 [Microcoleus sp. Pol8_D6]|uniref:hypothetical protein n=1 Tax=Microcoleus sp. Pol8_D6 TaxID=2818899 RepID=UPI002FD14F85